MMYGRLEREDDCSNDEKYTKTFPPGERNWYTFNNIFLVICIIPYLVTSRTKYALRQ